MRIAVVDDEKTYHRIIDDFIKKWKEETRHREVTVDYFENAERLFFSLDNSLYDLYLLDIRLPMMNGFELGEAIRQLNKQVVIAFITCDDGYLEKGYELSIFRYIRKPLYYDKIRQCLDYAWLESENKGVSLTIQSRTSHIKLLYKDIDYITAGIHNISVHTRDNKQYKMTIKTSFDQFAKSIPYPFMIRVHRGFLVNMEYVDRFTRTEVNLYTTPEAIPIGRLYHDEAIHKLKQYFNSDII